MSASRVRVLIDDPYVDWGDGTVQFRLTYQGLLLSETNQGRVQAARADHKQEIRKQLHPQLRRLWEINPYLASASEPPLPGPGRVFGRPRPKDSIAGRAERFSINDYRFVPLVTSDSGVLCSVDVLFLRSDPPGGAFRAGDIDNRLKTLFDALTMPRDRGQLGKYVVPDADEDPFFCLLEDDALITRASVETDTLLQPISTPANAADARVIITIKTSVYRMEDTNLGFA